MTRDEIEAAFPNLIAGEYEIASPATHSYNCIAFAAGDEERWWWPDPLEVSYWPPQAPRYETVAAFVEAFRLLGYEPCPGADAQQGFEKIAIYAKDETPTHAARMDRVGRWVSKLGTSEDIVHQLHQLEGNVYGCPVAFLRRPLEQDA